MTKATKGILRLGLGLSKPTIRVSSKAIVLIALLFIVQHTKRPRDHLEGFVGVLVAVLVRVGEQRLLAVGLFDVALGGGLAHGLEVEDLVEVGGLALADAEYGGLLLGRVLALLVALVVFAVAGGGRRVFAGVCPGGGCAGHGRCFCFYRYGGLRWRCWVASRGWVGWPQQGRLQ